MIALEDLGFRSDLLPEGAPLEEGLRPARIASVYGIRVDVWLPEGIQMVAVRRQALRDAPIEGGLAVGDWVLVGSAAPGSDEVVVERVLPRRTAFLRQAAGERAEPQAIAANVDRVLIVTALDGDFSARRLERYLVAIAGSGAEPVIVLTKADLADDAARADATAVSTALAPTLLTSARTGLGMDELRAQMPRGITVAFVGSSGVGKSALVNALLGEGTQAEGAVREHDNRGRHTTTRRSLFLLPGGGLLVDTPGMRELKPWQAGEESDGDAEGAFADVMAVAASCRYRDCRHGAEPGCAVRAAVEAGTLDRDHVASLAKLEDEKASRKARQDTFAGMQEKRKARAGAVALRKHLETKRGRS